MSLPTAEDGASLRERKKVATRSAIHTTALRLVREHGLAGVTIDQICADAGISRRTFFNYYPTKVAAAMDLVEVQVSPKARDEFLAGSGDLMDDLCVLVAASVNVPSDFGRIKSLCREFPELALALRHQLSIRRDPLIELVEQRTGNPHLASLAFGLITIALGSAIRSPDDDPSNDLVALIHRELEAVGRLVGRPA